MATSSSKKLHKLALIDDHAMFRKALASYIAGYDNYSVLYEAGSGKELLSFLKDSKNQHPDIVLLDIRMPEMDGFAVAEFLKNNYPLIKILALSSDDDGRTISRIVRNGAKGFISKNLGPEDLLEALNVLMKGDFYLPQSHLNEMVQAMHNNNDLTPENIQLTEKEKEFLTWACSELTYKDIADKMFVSTRTIEDYRDTIYKKLGVHTRQELVLYAVRNDLAPKY
ncbi:MAG: response regulator transcription factor [Bacteroidetes bacterium]|nr:response regulator transcription factor [Bacteroidota bacterium]MBS1639578.1 response regulator transcription factor [Bacteroidota bacterium]MBS1641651.1 response regulator transcription factor [Bacteroidota bacterium]MBS1671413.1 response regulator transcription factor [Bacteroidota bacterium]